MFNFLNHLIIFISFGKSIKCYQIKKLVNLSHKNNLVFDLNSKKSLSCCMLVIYPEVHSKDLHWSFLMNSILKTFNFLNAKPYLPINKLRHLSPGLKKNAFNLKWCLIKILFNLRSQNLTSLDLSSKLFSEKKVLFSLSGWKGRKRWKIISLKVKKHCVQIEFSNLLI